MRLAEDMGGAPCSCRERFTHEQRKESPEGWTESLQVKTKPNSAKQRRLVHSVVLKALLGELKPGTAV